jgi:two-component system sensor histidine kinase MprB
MTAPQGPSWLGRISFRARLGSLVALAVGVAVAAASLASYFAVHHQLLSQVDSTLSAELSALTPNGVLNVARANGVLQRTGSLLNVNATNCAQVIVTPDEASLPCGAGQSALALSGGTQFRTVSYDGAPFRVIAFGGNLSGVQVVVQIARPLADVDHTLSDLRLILWLVSIAGVAVAVGIGWLVGRATMRPVERLTAAAEHVAATQDLDATIDVQGEDELARLARSFNSMLEALAASRQQQAQLISDAGHELRTPLTSLRTNIEVLMKVRDVPDADKEALLGDVRAQLEELTTLVGDVVDLAREDEHRTEPIEVRLDEIVQRAIERSRRRASSVIFDTRLTPGSVRAHPGTLERAVLNVLDNATKWSPPGGIVKVTLERGTHWVLEVKDQGPGIPAEDLPHVFERFYRAASARSMPGSGLGLAIVHQVINEHGGTVAISSPPGGGTLVRIELPTTVEAEPGWEPERPERSRPHPAATGVDSAWGPLAGAPDQPAAEDAMVASVYPSWHDPSTHDPSWQDRSWHDPSWQDRSWHDPSWQGPSDR